MNRTGTILRNLLVFARLRISLMVATIVLIVPAQANAQWSPLPGGGIDLRARAAIVHNDGSGPAVFVCGRFNQAGGVAANNIAKWNGSVWSALGSGLLNIGVPFQMFGMTMAVYDDGLGGGPQLYAAGIFDTAGGVAAKNIARWNGQAWHALPIPFDGIAIVYCMTVFDDGSGPALYIGGRFESIGGQPARALIKWNGLAWSEVGGGVTHVGTSTLAYVVDLTVYDDGSGPGLVAGGLFNRVGGSPIKSLAMWRSNAWSAIGGDVAGSLNGEGVITALVPWSGEQGPELICQGSFYMIGDDLAHKMARWDGRNWHDMAGPVTNDPSEMGGRIRVAHTSDGCPELFAHVRTTEYIMRWNGHHWRTLDDAYFGNALWSLLLSGPVEIPFLDMVEFNNQLIVVGSFTFVSAMPAPGVAIWGLEALYPCDADITHDESVDVNDLLAVITTWGICTDCPADRVPCGGDGQVNATDLLMVITHWGPCP